MVLPVLWWMMNLCKHHQLIDLAVGRWQKLQEEKVSVHGMKNQPPYKQLGFISAPTKGKAVMWTQWFPSQFGLLGGCSVCSCQPSSTCDPPGPAPAFAAAAVLLNDYRREERCRKGSSGLKLRDSRAILWELGHRGTCSPASCAVSGLGDQILRVSVCLSAATLKKCFFFPFLSLFMENWEKIFSSSCFFNKEYYGCE